MERSGAEAAGTQRVRAAQMRSSEVSMLESRSRILHLDQKGATEPL